MLAADPQMILSCLAACAAEDMEGKAGHLHDDGCQTNSGNASRHPKSAEQVMAAMKDMMVAQAKATSE